MNLKTSAKSLYLKTYKINNKGPAKAGPFIFTRSETVWLKTKGMILRDNGLENWSF